MFKHIRTFIIVLLIISSVSQKVNAKSIPSTNELIENAKNFDEKEVIIQGEVIGECMNRGDNTWININDGTNAIGVWLRKSEGEKILHYGNYKNKGEIVKITGIFNRACNEHGGEADIHNISMVIIKKGFVVKEDISPQKIITTVVLTVITLLYVLFYRKRLK